MAKRKRTSIPPKEQELGHNGSQTFGLCKHCGHPLKYPGIGFPEKLIENRSEAGVSDYTIETTPMHYSCVADKLIQEGYVDYDVTTEFITRKPWHRKLLTWLLDKFQVEGKSEVQVKKFQKNKSFNKD